MHVIKFRRQNNEVALFGNAQNQFARPPITPQVIIIYQPALISMYKAYRLKYAEHALFDCFVCTSKINQAK